jgi:hypothetical protein
MWNACGKGETVNTKITVMINSFSTGTQNIRNNNPPSNGQCNGVDEVIMSASNPLRARVTVNKRRKEANQAPVPAPSMGKEEGRSGRDRGGVGGLPEIPADRSRFRRKGTATEKGPPNSPPEG